MRSERLQNQQRKWLIACTIAIAAVLTGCSVPDYSKPIGAFAVATQKAGFALDSANSGAADAFAINLKDQVLRGDAILAEKSCRSDGQGCRLVVKRKGKSDVSYPPAPPLVKSVKVMKAIASYAAGLAAISGADTADKVKGSVAATFGSIKGIATALGNNKSLPDFTSPLSAFVTLSVQHHVAQVKLAALRAATQDAQPVLDDAADAFTTIIRVSSNLQFLQSRAQMRNLLFEAAEGPVKVRRKAFDAAVSSAATAHGLAQAGKTTIFKKMAASHDALRLKIHDREVSMGDVVAAISRFSAEAEAILKLFK